MKLSSFVILFLVVSLQSAAQPNLPRLAPLIFGSNSTMQTPTGILVSMRAGFFQYKNYYDGNGKKVDSEATDVIMLLPNLSYAFPKPVLKAQYTAGLTFPMINLQPIVNGPTPTVISGLGLGDVVLIPVALKWKFHPLYPSFAYNFISSSGRYSVDDPSNNLGAGYITHALLLGLTYVFGEEERWSISGMNRFEFNGKQKELDKYAGSNYTLDYAVAKKLNAKWRVAGIGYFTFQLDEERGKDAAKDTTKYRYMGLGVEGTYTPSHKVVLQLRIFHDLFGVINASRKLGLYLNVAVPIGVPILDDPENIE